MAGLKKSELIARNGELRQRIAALEEALHGGLLSGALDAMAEGVADGAILLDGEHRVTYLNPGAERLLGRAAADVVGQPVSDFLDRTSSAEFHAALAVRPTAADHLPARAIRTTLRVCRRDGTLVPVQAALTGWRASSGPVRALLLRDLSPLEAASALVRESEGRFEALAEAAPVGIYRTDLQGRCVYVSRQWKELTGLDDVGALGDGWQAAIHPEDRARLGAVWGVAVATGEMARAEYRMVHVDGREFWVLGQAVPERDAAGTMVGFVGTITEITGLRLREESFRLLFDDNPSPMWVYDLETLRFLEVNEAALALYGYSRDQWLAMTIVDIRPAEDVPRLLDNLQQPRSPCERSATWRHQRRNGTIMAVRFASHTLRFEGREAVLVVLQAATPGVEA